MRVRVLLAALLGALGFAGAANAGNYLVLYAQQGVPGNAGASILAAGGTLVASYDQIGVAVASSTDVSFAANLSRADASVQAVQATAGYGVRLHDTESA